MIATTPRDRGDVPNRPEIAGLRFRRWRGPADIPAMVEVNRVARDAYGVRETVTVAGMTNDYANLSNSSPDRDLLVVELEGRVVGYARVEWQDQQDGSRAYDTVAVLRPELRGRGIGSAVLGWLEQRARTIAGRHRTTRPRFHQAWTWDADTAARELLAARGYEPVRRSYEMVRPTLDDLPDPPIPEGAEVRPVGREHLRAIWEADLEAFRDHWGEIDESDAAWRRYRDDPVQDPTLYAVAFAGHEIAGHALGVVDPAHIERFGLRQGLVGSVAVRRPWRRRGLARALVARCLRLLRERGMESAYLGVDAENPNQALHLYTDLGFEVVSSETAWRKPLELERDG